MAYCRNAVGLITVLVRLDSIDSQAHIQGLLRAKSAIALKLKNRLTCLQLFYGLVDVERRRGDGDNHDDYE